ncbi:MAG: efflux RND transporter permease subunit, partial [Actinomycetia bacterium]|nr:efflux RND transporter permease subunit [Actinomycetes bacterium]
TSGGTILRSAVRIRGPLVYATAIAVVAVVPALVIPGSLGALVAPLAIAYLVALVVAMIVAVALTSALGSLLLAGAAQAPRLSPVLDAVTNGYSRFAPTLVTRGVPALVAAVVLVALGVGLVPAIATNLTPQLKEPDLLIAFDGAPATSQPEMSRIVSAATAELRALPGVAEAGGHVGRALLSDVVADVNSGEIWVHIDPAADHGATVAAVEAVVAGYPGLNRSVSNYLTERSADLLAGPSSDLVVRVYGEDVETLAGKAEEVRKALVGVDGLVDPRVIAVPQDPTIEIKVDLAVAQRYRVKPGEVRRTVATLVNGIGVGSIFEQQKVFDVVVRGVPEVRDSLTAIGDILIDLPDGGQVALRDVAQVRVAQSPSVIQRESVSRYVDVVGAVAGRSRADVAADAAAAIRTVSFPFEYRAEVLTGYERSQSGVLQIVGVGIAAAVVIFLLLQAAFRRWRLAVLAVLTLPVALSGGLVAVLLSGRVLTIGSIAGLVTVLALATRHMITLIRHYQQLEWDGDAFGPALVQIGTRDRVGPIVTSMLATAAAMLPIAVLGAQPGLELLAPMAVAVLGGLVTAAVLNLLIVPALYLRFAGANPRPPSEDEEDTGPVQLPAELATSAPTTASQA